MWGGDEPRDRRDGQGGPVQDPTGRLVVAPVQRKEADYLKVLTTRMRPGYLQRNGVPYSANATVTEYYHRTSEPNGDSWLIVTTVVEDPRYLAARFVTSSHFKKVSDGSNWNPTPCEGS